MVKVSNHGNTKDVWANAFYCKKASLPITYLGLPLGAKSSSKAFWNPILNRIEKRLASWKIKFLNKGVSTLFGNETTSKRILKDGLNIVLGDGSKANFWGMSGGDMIKIKVACPIVYALAIRKLGVVQDFGS
ncbi:hypothetical protein Dsin_013341 [Dipteronia sinensis]|uniref:RNA-directed DNA polymerase (Reverse transcriptase) n=1 Tax=Dipteronia sinensis TaxID=43782 RepID=A0AAE0AJR3_9ROSI|nr:hypothetical protein Dsin_013341 [Dipteronia sinensis]